MGADDDTRVGGASADTPGAEGISRKRFLTGTAAAGAALGLGGANAAFANSGSSQPATPRSTPPDEELILHNGKFRTMDDQNRVFSEVAIRGGRFVEVGKFGRRGRNAIDLKGRVVIPGLIESCDHIVSFGNYRPGYHTILENATSIAEIQAILAARRAEVPAGEWITSLGAWTAETMFAEHRLPNRAELDAAVPDRPVLLYQTTVGPASVNSLGKAYFESASTPVVVGADGRIASGIQSTTALYLLRQTQTPEQRRRCTQEAWAYCASVGLTSHIDQQGIAAPPSPQYELGNAILTEPSLNPNQTLFHFDHFRHYDTWAGLHREGKTTVRMQADFVIDTLDVLNERIKNQLPYFGDDMMSTHAVHWQPTGGVGNPIWLEGYRLMARFGWRGRSGGGSVANMETAIAGWEQLATEYDISDLRWTLHRMSDTTNAQLDRLKALGGTVNVVSRSYPLPAATAPAAPFRTVVDNGIHAGIHMDGGHIATLNPWITIYFAVTGRNGLGELVNPGQQITRQEALRLFTRANAYQMRMEDKLGSIEAGKLADLVVLDKDYLAVNDEDLKKIRSVLTIVDGKITHDTGAVKVPR